MTHIDKHSPGSFCWIELATTDQNAAKDFYSSLFGWTADDSPIGPSEFYTIFKLDGRDAAAGYTLRADQRAQGVPPNWMIYIAVKSADEAAIKAKQLGGTVVMPPFDVMDFGRMAVIQDPTGAHFCVWQAAKNAGIGIAHVAGTLCWADLSTPDAKRATDFYSGLFGWQIVADEKDKSGYLHIIASRACLHIGWPISGSMTLTLRLRRRNRWARNLTWSRRRLRMWGAWR